MHIAQFTRFEQPAYFLLRVFSGLLFACHGAQKLFGVLGGSGAEGPMMMIAGVVEFFGGLMIAAGLLTQIVAFLSAGQMMVAYMMVHMPRGLWPIQNGGELALLYLFIFLYIMTRGGGRFSLDTMISAPSKTSEV